LPKFTFHKYASELAKYADKIDVHEATSTSRIGHKRIRDMFVFWRNTYSEGSYYLGMFKDILFLFALIPLALITAGLPVTLTPGLAAAYLGGCCIIGFVSYRFLKLPRREKELEDLMSMSRYLTWDMLKQIQVEIKQLEHTVIKKKIKRRVKK